MRRMSYMIQIGLLSAVCLVGLSMRAQAQGGFGGPSPSFDAMEQGRGGHGEMRGHQEGNERRGPDFEKMAQELGLTEEQQTQLKEHRQQSMQQAKAIREQLKSKKEEIRQELQKEDVDIARVKAIHEQIKALIAQREDGRLEGILKLREVLTAEQFQKMHEKMAQGRRHFNERFSGRTKGQSDPVGENGE